MTSSLHENIENVCDLLGIDQPPVTLQDDKKLAILLERVAERLTTLEVLVDAALEGEDDD